MVYFFIGNSIMTFNFHSNISFITKLINQQTNKQVNHKLHNFEYQFLIYGIPQVRKIRVAGKCTFFWKLGEFQQTDQ